MKHFLLISTILGMAPCTAQTCDLTLNGSFGCVSPTFHVSQFPGATAGDQLVACVAALPASGGVCDARDIPANSVFNSITLPGSGVHILWPCSVITLNGSLTVFATGGVRSVRWEGCGSPAEGFGQGTTFLWNGNATDSAIRLRGVRDSEFSNFSVYSNSSRPLATAIQSETVTGQVTTRNIYRNIIISGTTNAVGKGIRWCAGDDCGGAGGDINNDFSTISNVMVLNYGNCAYSIEHSQSKTHSFRDSAFLSGQRGVCTTQAANPAHNSGSFRWSGGGGGNTTVADFDLGAVDDNIVIRDCNQEDSARLLQTNGGSAAQWPILIEGCTWVTTSLNADNNVVLYQDHGPLTLIANQIIATGPGGSSPQFMIAATGTPSKAIAIANSFKWGVATSQSNPLAASGGATWSSIGNMISDIANNQFILSSSP